MLQILCCFWVMIIKHESGQNTVISDTLFTCQNGLVFHIQFITWNTTVIVKMSLGKCEFSTFLVPVRSVCLTGYRSIYSIYCRLLMRDMTAGLVQRAGHRVTTQILTCLGRGCLLVGWNGLSVHETAQSTAHAVHSPNDSKSHERSSSRNFYLFQTLKTQLIRAGIVNLFITS
jgi:hypothetical protein